MRVIVLLLCLAGLTSPVHAQDAQDYAEGAAEVLAFQPDLPSGASTASQLQEILARPEFNKSAPAPKGPTLLERILQWFAQRLGGIGAGLAGAGTATMVVAGLLIAGLLVLMVYTVVRAVWSRLTRVRALPDSAVPEDLLSAASLRELASRAAKSGDYQSAVRLRFKSVVARLDVLGSERQTNWQLLRYVRRNHPAATSDFAELIGIFEDSWYGGRRANEVEFARADGLASKVEAVLMPRVEAA